MDANDEERKAQRDALALITLSPVPVSEANVRRALGLTQYRAAQILAALEADGKIRRPEGRRYGWEVCDGAADD